MNQVPNSTLRAMFNVLPVSRRACVLALVIAGAGLLAGHRTTIAWESPATYTLTGKVVHISDGDTFGLQASAKQHTVRLASVDAPERSRDGGRPGQPHASAARDALASLIRGKTLTLKCYEKDHYDRYICDVPLDNGSTANRLQVAAGMAWANMEGRGKFMRDPELPDIEAGARRDRLGIWQDARPVPPWVWRYQCWRKHLC